MAPTPMASRAQPNADQPGQKQRSALLSFTGLIPVALSIPILLFRLWTLGIMVGVVSTAVVIAYHLRKGQGITGLDLMSLVFGVGNAVLYFGFHNTVLLDHLDVLIYTLLFAQVAYAQVRGGSWTIQFARRSVAPELWNTTGFVEGNRFVSLLWAACFGLCDVAALAGPTDAIKLWVPVVLLVATGVLTPRLARWYGTRVAQARTS